MGRQEPVQDRTVLLSAIYEYYNRTRAIEGSRACTSFACLPLFSEYLDVTKMCFRVINKIRNPQQF